MMNILPEFESRQVLTSDELNWLTCYLDSQNRQSRRMLIGCGVIGGLQVQLNGASHSIQITNGCAVTSAGYIISLQHDNNVTVYTKIKKYAQKNKEKLAFPYLCDEDDLQQNYAKSVDIPSVYFAEFKDDVFELFEDAVNDAAPINATSVNGKVVLLFAEIIQKELKDCEEDNCQERGKKYVFNTKPLLISQQDAIKLLQIQHNVASNTAADISKKAFPWLHLPNINILKPVFSNINHPDGFNEQLITQEYLRCITDLQSNLSTNSNSIDEALNNIHNYRAIIKTSFSLTQPVIQFINKNIIFNNTKSPFLVQLVYDYLWNIVKAYQELQLAAQDLRAQCLIEETAFPNHVLLGLVDAQNSDFETTISSEYNIYRHFFYSQFTQTEQALLGKKITLLVTRLKSLLTNFDDNIFTGAKEIKLTTGGHLYQALSWQAIPYYLKPAISNTWNQYARHPHLKQYNTSYYSTDESKQTTTVNPYNTHSAALQGNATFFRVEGVHGQAALTALNNVFQLRKKHGLAFEVLMLRLNKEAPFNHSFNFTINEDIESMYQVARAELLKQIKLNVAYLDGLQLKKGKFSEMQKTLISALEKSYLSFLGTLNLSLLQPITLVLADAVMASNITTNNTAKVITSDTKFQELTETVAKATIASQPYSLMSNLQVVASRQPLFSVDFGKFVFLPIFLVPDTFGSLVDSIKDNDKFKETTAISFYSHLLTIAKSMQQTGKQEVLFSITLQLYCALRLQEQYLTENFLEFNIDQYSKNLNDELLPACNAMIGFLKKSSIDFVRNDTVLTEVIKGEMLDYADRIKFDDDWVKMNQIDAENKKRNGGLGVENLLDRFVQLHPGMAHGCGVPNGGTYIMVYDKNNKVTADFYLPYIISSHLRPIQYTLLENKTITLSGKITDAGNKPVEANVRVGDAMVFSNKEGFYNCLVAANTTVHIVCDAVGFITMEKDVQIKNASQVLDIKLEAQAKKTTTIKFVNQNNEAITADIKLLDTKQNEVVAKKAVLKVTEAPNTTTKYKVIDDNFEELEFTVKIANADTEQVVTLTAVNFLAVKIRESNGAFNPDKLSKIELEGTNIKLKDSGNGIFVSENKIATGKELTVQVTYNQQRKTQTVSSGIEMNEVVFESAQPEDRNKDTWLITTNYPVILTHLVKYKLSLNGKEIEFGSANSISNSTIKYDDGTLNIDFSVVNAPKIKTDKLNLEKISAVIVSIDVNAVLSNVANIKEALFTFYTSLNEEALERVIRNLPWFDQIPKEILLKENFYCFLLSPNDKNKIKEIFRV